eukprot:scaffold11.g4029.t1
MKAPFAVLLALATVAVLVGAQQEIEWKGPSNYAPVKLTTGQSVTLMWNATTPNTPHGVWAVPSNACPPQFTAGNGLSELVAPAPQGSWTFSCNSTSSGDHFYACPVDGHCKLGMLLQISCSA